MKYTAYYYTFNFFNAQLQVTLNTTRLTFRFEIVSQTWRYVFRAVWSFKYDCSSYSGAAYSPPSTARLRTNVSYSLYSFAHTPSWRTGREICFQGEWEQSSDKTLRSFDMVMKPTNTYKRLRVSYLIYTVCLLDVSTALVAILREVHYKGYITKIFWTYAQR